MNPKPSTLLAKEQRRGAAGASQVAEGTAESPGARGRGLGYRRLGFKVGGLRFGAKGLGLGILRGSLQGLCRHPSRGFCGVTWGGPARMM